MPATPEVVCGRHPERAAIFACDRRGDRPKQDSGRSRWCALRSSLHRRLARRRRRPRVCPIVDPEAWWLVSDFPRRPAGRDSSRRAADQGSRPACTRSTPPRRGGARLRGKVSPPVPRSNTCVASAPRAGVTRQSSSFRVNALPACSAIENGLHQIRDLAAGKVLAFDRRRQIARHDRRPPSAGYA